MSHFELILLVTFSYCVIFIFFYIQIGEVYSLSHFNCFSVQINKIKNNNILRLWLSFVWYWKKAINIHPFHPLLLNAGWQRQHDKLTISLPVSTLFLCQNPWSRYKRRNEMPSEFWSLSRGRRTFIKPCHTWTQQRVKSLTTVNKMSDNAWGVPSHQRILACLWESQHDKRTFTASGYKHIRLGKSHFKNT